MTVKTEPASARTGGDWTAFGVTLARLRAQAGFPSAGRFYRQCGGRAAFGCTYRQYANVEAGGSGPSGELLARLCRLLRLDLDAEAAASMARAYLRGRLPEEAASLFQRALTAGGAPPLQRALARRMRERTFPLSVAQVEAYTRDEACYGVFLVLSNDLGRWSAAEMGRVLALPETRVARAAKALARAGLLKVGAQARYWCPHAGRILIPVQTPEREAEIRAAFRRLPGLRRKLARGREEVLWKRLFVTRCSAREIAEYAPRLAEAVDGAALLERKAAGDDTRLAVVEARVTSLFPF